VVTGVYHAPRWIERLSWAQTARCGLSLVIQERGHPHGKNPGGTMMRCHPRHSGCILFRVQNPGCDTFRSARYALEHGIGATTYHPWTKSATNSPNRYGLAGLRMFGVASSLSPCRALRRADHCVERHTQDHHGSLPMKALISRNTSASFDRKT